MNSKPPETIVMERRFYGMMDRFFHFLLLLSGEEETDEISIDHIL
jgi:hypothetical protein